MRYQGSLIQWNDDRGFGWIAADEGGEKIFVHISAFVPRPHADQRPRKGQRLKFAVGMDKGKKCAQQVAWRSSNMWLEQTQPARRSASVARSPQSSRSATGWHASSRFSYGALIVWGVLMQACAVLWSVPAWIWLAYMGLSVLTFMMYWQDKWAAQKVNGARPRKPCRCLRLLVAGRVRCWPSSGCATNRARPAFSCSSGAWHYSMPCLYSGCCRLMGGICWFEAFLPQTIE